MTLTALPAFVILSYQLKLTKMLAELTNLNHCAVPFLSRAAVNLWWYDYTPNSNHFVIRVNDRNHESERSCDSNGITK